MNNTDEIIWIIYIGAFVAIFPLNTSRVLQATELCQECLILLNNTPQEQVVEEAHGWINTMLFQAYRLLNHHTSAINCGRKVLDFLRGFGLRAVEGKLTDQLAELYEHQGEYKEAEELYKKALSIMTATGDRNPARDSCHCIVHDFNIIQPTNVCGLACSYDISDYPPMFTAFRYSFL